MDFYLTTSASTLPRFQITWLPKIFFSEFAKIYERLGVTLIERGESFYQDLMGIVVEDLEKLGTVMPARTQTVCHIGLVFILINSVSSFIYL